MTARTLIKRGLKIILPVLLFSFLLSIKTYAAPQIRGSFDMHEHFRVNGNMELYLKVARGLGIKKTIFVPTGNAPDNAGYKEHMAALLKEQKKHPDRIIAFCSIDEADPGASEIFEKCLDEEGKGLKILGGHKDFYDVPLNNDTMKQVFKIAQDRNVPVMAHVSIMRLPAAKAEFMDLLDQFPGVRVQYSHYCSSIYYGINLDQCAEFLDKYPNLYVDLAMGSGAKGFLKYMMQEGGLEKIRNFILKYQDRILHGTDMILAGGKSATQNKKFLRDRIKCEFDLYKEKFYKCPLINGKDTLLPGFSLPRQVLRKIYIDNPKKFLGK